MKVKKFDVTGVGSVAVDFIGSIEKWPEIGTKNPFLGFDIFDGGLTGTALTAVSRLGGKASFIGKLGSSEMAKRAFLALEKEGIDTSNVIKDENSEPIIAFVLSNMESDQRNIFFRKDNLNFPFQNEIPDPDWFKKTRLLFTDHVAGDAGLEAVSVARSNNLPIVVDIERIQDNTEDLLKFSNHVIVSQRFAEIYSGSAKPDDQFKSLKKHKSQSVIITKGEEGCICMNGKESVQIPGIWQCFNG